MKSQKEKIKMSFGKKAKVKQTDWTIGGRDISNTAVPLYQENLQKIADYNLGGEMDKYMNKYYGLNSDRNNEFLTAYQRATGKQTGNNYAATSGGYSSSGQRQYDDLQKYYDHLAASLQDYGVTGAANLAQAGYGNLLQANNAYNNAYGLGENYSKIDQANDLIDQENKNWYSNALSGVGGALSAIPTPFTKAIGGAMMLGGAGTKLDTSNAWEVLGNNQAGAAARQAQLGNLTGAGAGLGQGYLGFMDNFNNNNGQWWTAGKGNLNYLARNIMKPQKEEGQ